MTTYVGKPFAIGQPTRPTQPFILCVNKLSSYQLYRMYAGRIIWWVFTRLSRCGFQPLCAVYGSNLAELNPSVYSLVHMHAKMASCIEKDILAACTLVGWIEGREARCHLFVERWQPRTHFFNNWCLGFSDFAFVKSHFGWRIFIHSAVNVEHSALREFIYVHSCSHVIVGNDRHAEKPWNVTTWSRRPIVFVPDKYRLRDRKRTKSGT